MLLADERQQELDVALLFRDRGGGAADDELLCEQLFSRALALFRRC
jgi:hypothetical protein